MIDLSYQLQLDTPAHIGTGYGFAGFLDSVVVRDTAGLVYLPGSSIKGKVRATTRRLAHNIGLAICTPYNPCGLTDAMPCPVCRLFGSPHFAGRLYFDNAQLPAAFQDLFTWLHEQDPLAARSATTGQRTQVMLSRLRRAALPDHLFVTELVWEGLVFQGRISGEAAASASTTAADLALLWAGLSLITHVGRARARGLGRCHITVDLATLAAVPFTSASYQVELHRLTEGVRL